MAGTASAQVSYPVDDFEVLGFDLVQSGPGSSSDLQFAAPSQIGGHIICAVRQVTCSVGSIEGSTTASLAPGTAYNDAMHASVPSAGSVSLLWDLGFSADLTAAGAVDRIEVSVGAPTGNNVRMALVDENTNSALVDVPNPPTNIPVFPLSAFTGVDVENVRQIVLVLTDPGIHDVFDV